MSKKSFKDMFWKWVCEKKHPINRYTTPKQMIIGYMIEYCNDNHIEFIGLIDWSIPIENIYNVFVAIIEGRISYAD